MHAAVKGHTVPHVPQWLVLLLVSTHVVPHAVCPEGHSQTPATHDAVLGQRLPQVPQL